MKLKSSIVAIIALSGISFAGGDIGGVTSFENDDYVQAEAAAEVKEVEPAPAPVAAPAPVVTKSGFYVGGALTDVAVRTDDRANLFADKVNQDRQVGLTGVVGYDFMNYLGAELRATMGVANETTDKFKHVGAYLKPNIDVMDALNLYGLVGFGKANMASVDGTETGFTYGAGLDYDVTENISVFTDAVNYMKKEDTNSQWGANLGIKYNF